MEIDEFLKQTQREIREEVNKRLGQAGGEIAFHESVFTDVVSQHMSEFGITFEDPVVCHYQARGLNLSGYALSEDSDQLDLYVSLYKNVDELENVSKTDTTRAAKNCSNFLTQCVEGKLLQKMDKSSEAYELVQIIHDGYAHIDQIRIFILTDGQARDRNFKSRAIEGKTVKLEVMDIVRLFNHWQEGKPRDELVVNFEEVSGGPLPCVWVPNEMEEYDYAMTAVPGDVLRFLYDKYGTRILEANVRSFLSLTRKVNKGISQTLREQPERFMAYNNGIVIVADEARLGRSSDGTPGITWLKGMQIVNGGQTTASMFFTKKKFPAIDLKKVRVPAKVIVLKESDPAQEEALISDISRFSNSQTQVSVSDLSSNNPYHVAVEKLAMTTFCPDGYGRWFYERSAGSYKVMLEREGRTPAGIKKKKAEIPPFRKIIKTDLAKFICAWKQRPDLVSLGGQKNFAAFMAMVAPEGGEQKELPETDDFKEMIAQAIIFKAAQKIIRPEFPAFKANIAAYTVSILSLLGGGRLDLMQIWKKQGVSEELASYMLYLAKEVDQHLHETAEGKMISEWAKKKECWDQISSMKYAGLGDQILELKPLGV